MLFLTGILFLPLLQQRLQFINVAPLGGFYSVPAKPVLSKATWLDGTFAEGANTYFDFNLGFRPWLIRCRNTFYYWVLQSSGQYDFMVGKHRNIFYNNNVYAATGKDFVGKEFISNRIKKLAYVADKLSEKGIKLFVVLAPGKANLYTADLPMAYLPADSVNTNYYWLKKNLVANKLPLIDFHEQYAQLKKTSPYPIYSYGSLHWSTYHYMHSWDSILNYINSLGGKPVSDFVIGPVVQSDSASLQEMDQLPGMNVFGTLQKQTYYYPKYAYRNVPVAKAKTLFISDSFVLTFMANNLTNDAMDAQCWFYHRDVYPQSYTKPLALRDINYWGELYKQDYVCVLMSEVTWGEAGFEFADKVYNHLTDGINAMLIEFDSKVMSQYTFISSDLNSKQMITSKAVANNISFERMAYLDAIYLINLDFTNNLGADTTYKLLFDKIAGSKLMAEHLAQKDKKYALGSDRFYVEAFTKYVTLSKVLPAQLDSLLQLKSNKPL